MSTFDIVILILLVFGGIAGFQKGLITGLSRFIGKIAAIGIAVFFHMQFLNSVEPVLGLRIKIKPIIESFLEKIVESKSAAGGQFGDTGSFVGPVIGEATAVLTNYVLKIGAVITLFLLAVFIINIIIAVIITPLAKTLSFVNRGGGFAFGILSMLVGLCLCIGLMGPFLMTANTEMFRVSDSVLYPWLIEGYEVLLGIISAFAGDIFTNPLESLPFY